MAYVGIVYYSFRYKNEEKIFMPFIAGLLDFAWEVNAVIVSHGYWAHILWISLDVFILIYNIYLLKKLKRQISYGMAVLLLTAVLYVVFQRASGGMLISSFIIDIIMITEYVVTFKQISSRGKTLIGVLKLLGDFSAWVENLKYSNIVFAIGGFVLILNIYYVYMCIEEKREKHL